MSWRAKACISLCACAGLAHWVVAQTALGSISGRVVSESGLTVRAVVTLQPAIALGFPAGHAHRVLAASNGAFTFGSVRPGQYNICAQIPASEASPSAAPFLDTCEWGSSHAPVGVASGQQVTGVSLTAPSGAVLQIQVADPNHLLPAVVSAAGPAALESQLALIIRGPDRRIHHAHFAFQTAAGRTYQAVVPVGTALSVAVASPVANVLDQNGNKVAGEIPAQAAAGLTPTPISFTLQRPGN